MTDFRYTPRTVGMIKLHERTMTPATIATIMRCPASTIELICRKHGIDMRSEDYVAPEPPSKVDRRSLKHVEIHVDGLSLYVIANEAHRRGIPTRDLIARLIEAIAEDHVFGAVLDR